MTIKQPDWRNADDYSYLDELDLKGWAWEFLRRGKKYRQAYAPFRARQAQEGDAWRQKQPVVLYEPKKLAGESDAAWEQRAARQGLHATRLTESRLLAREWSLFDMYDPAQPYDEHFITFRLSSPYPAFYGDPAPIPEETKHPNDSKALRRLRPFEDLHNGNEDIPPEALLVIAFDVRRSMDDQLASVHPVFQACAHRLTSIRNPTLGKKYKSYIRFLDALDAGAEADMHLYEILLAVDSSDRVQNTDYEKRLDMASYAKKAARKLADTDHKKLLSGFVPE